MAFLGETFNVNDLPQGTGSYDPVPEGWYDAHIVKADLNPTKDGTGQRINVRYDITGPTHQGRVVFGGINIRNKSPRAEEIGRQQLGDIARAIGLASVQDTDQLVGAPVKIKVRIKEGNNEVVGWKSLGGSPAPVAAPAAPASAPSAPATNGAAPPWAKK